MLGNAKYFSTLDLALGYSQIPLDDDGGQGQNPVLREFVAAIEEGRTPECNAADNLKSMAMVFAAVKSAMEGREVSIAEL